MATPSEAPTCERSEANSDWVGGPLGDKVGWPLGKKRRGEKGSTAHDREQQPIGNPGSTTCWPC
eukprot:scaffold131571_cov28-Tisochrysis_lutea.AAC.2